MALQLSQLPTLTRQAISLVIENPASCPESFNIFVIVYINYLAQFVTSPSLD